jgi:hypothetical protein
MGANTNIYKGQGGLRRSEASTDAVCGLVLHGMDIAPSTTALGIQFGEIKQLLRLKDAEDLGITDAYDKANEMLIWYHIAEFFRVHGRGELWIVIHPRGDQSWHKMLYLSTNDSDAQRLIDASGGRIRMLGIVLNPATSYTPLLYGGLDSKVFTMITAGQSLADYNFAKSKQCQIFVEGRQFNGLVSAANSLHNYAAPNVSVCVGADYSTDFRNSLSNDYSGNVHVKYHAAVGAWLGLYANAPVNVNPGFIGGKGFDLQDVNKKKFLATCLSSGTQYSDDDLDVLNEKGHQFFYKDIDAPGTYLKDTWTCVELISDYYCMENTRTFDKAAKGVRRDLIPLQNASVRLLPSGKLPKEVIESIKTKAATSLSEMRRAQEISGFSIEIDEDTLVSITGGIDVYFDIQTTQTLRKLNGYVRLVPNLI